MPCRRQAELATVEPARAIPEAAVARLAVYLRVLSGMVEQGMATVSSEELSAAAGVNSAKLRKDLSYIGSYGTRGVGYEVEVLVSQIERVLGLTRKHSVAVVGIGNLGHALANYGGFRGRGFPVAALFDVDPDLIGVPVGGILSTTSTTSRRSARRKVSRSASSRRRRPPPRRFATVWYPGRPVHPELRTRRAPGAGRRRGAQGRPGRRAADPVVPRGATGGRGIGRAGGERRDNGVGVDRVVIRP